MPVRHRISAATRNEILSYPAGSDLREVRFGGTPKPACETHALPRQTAGLVARGRFAREAADESIRREMPLKIRLTPMSVPIAQTELNGQRAQIRIPSRSVMMASNNTQPAFTRRRMLK